MSNTNNTLANAEVQTNAAQQSQSAEQGTVAFVTLETLRTLIQDGGYRAEIVTDGRSHFFDRLRMASISISALGTYSSTNLQMWIKSRSDLRIWSLSSCLQFRVLFLLSC